MARIIPCDQQSIIFDQQFDDSIEFPNYFDRLNQENGANGGNPHPDFMSSDYELDTYDLAGQKRRRFEEFQNNLGNLPDTLSNSG